MPKFWITAETVDYTVGQLAQLAALEHPLANTLADAYTIAVQNDNGDAEQTIGMDIEITLNAVWDSLRNQ